MSSIKTNKLTLHGHEVTYRQAGESGPVVVLIHGIAGNGDSWDSVQELLAPDHIVIAPDLLGHGRSAKPRGDYSLGAYASGIRDLLFALGHARATIIGHSLGGGVAMQFAYQFPSAVERLVLVSSGGLGRDLNIVLRAAALPGAEYVLPLLFKARLPIAGSLLAGAIERLGLRGGPDLEEIVESFESLDDTHARYAFLQTVRSVIDFGGQRVNATDRLYLATDLPSLIIWGERDVIIPVEHAHAARKALPGSRLEIFEGVGHFPHVSEPQRFARKVAELIAETAPARLDQHRLRDLLAGGVSKARRRASAKQRRTA
jgi:pimeloyl-ACP methyl ester carboxylesterase